MADRLPNLKVIVEAMKAQPALLAMVLANLAMLAFLFYMQQQSYALLEKCLATAK
jgi:hypothetical protein